jgi:hypothetical protein
MPQSLKSLRENRRDTADPSNREGPEGRTLNFSPARQGWDIDRNENPERRGRGTKHARRSSI